MTMKVEVAFEGLEEFIHEFKILGKNFSGEKLADLGRAGLTHPMTEAQNLVPRKTSTLYRSIRIEDLEIGEYHCWLALAAGGDHVPYAAIQEFGGVIRPVNARMLHWVNEAGQHVFANMVTIPAQPYMRPAWKSKQEAMEDEIARQAKSVVYAK